MAKKLLLAAFSDSTEDEPGPAALDDSGAAEEAAEASASPATLETGLIMLLTGKRPLPESGEASFYLLIFYARQDYETTTRLRGSEKLCNRSPLPNSPSSLLI